jgi:hypothetical protein
LHYLSASWSSSQLQSRLFVGAGYFSYIDWMAVNRLWHSWERLAAAWKSYRPLDFCRIANTRLIRSLMSRRSWCRVSKSFFLDEDVDDNRRQLLYRQSIQLQNGLQNRTRVLYTFHWSHRRLPPTGCSNRAFLLIIASSEKDRGRRWAILFCN